MKQRERWTLKEVSFFWDGETVHLNAWFRPDSIGTDCNVTVECSGRMVELVRELEDSLRDRIDEHLQLSGKYKGTHDVDQFYQD